MPHLKSDADQAEGGFDMELYALVQSPAMREAELPHHPICKTNFNYMYWTAAQMVTHHASNGCNMGAGATCSAAAPVRVLRGARPPACSRRRCAARVTGHCPNGERRVFLEDGDDIVLRGKAIRPGHVSIGFGDCAGRVMPAPKWPG